MGVAFVVWKNNAHEGIYMIHTYLGENFTQHKNFPLYSSYAKASIGQPEKNQDAKCSYSHANPRPYIARINPPIVPDYKHQTYVQ